MQNLCFCKTILSLNKIKNQKNRNEFQMYITKTKISYSLNYQTLHYCHKQKPILPIEGIQLLIIFSSFKKRNQKTKKKKWKRNWKFPITKNCSLRCRKQNENHRKPEFPIAHQQTSQTHPSRVPSTAEQARKKEKKKNRRQRVHSPFPILNSLLRKCRSSGIFSTMSRYVFHSSFVEKQRRSLLRVFPSSLGHSSRGQVHLHDNNRDIFLRRCSDSNSRKRPLLSGHALLDPMARATARIGIRN